MNQEHPTENKVQAVELSAPAPNNKRYMRTPSSIAKKKKTPITWWGRLHVLRCQLCDSVVLRRILPLGQNAAHPFFFVLDTACVVLLEALHSAPFLIEEQKKVILSCQHPASCSQNTTSLRFIFCPSLRAADSVSKGLITGPNQPTLPFVLTRSCLVRKGAAKQWRMKETGEKNGSRDSEADSKENFRTPSIHKDYTIVFPRNQD